ncbi:SCO family protein [uncultured Jatrophihabitans sp.]|uniref:SCO family protein n=1 Tax=uncultured Jatrophihabitans sp. TaxID=1610747 RepID=UPI0035C9D2AA
MKRPTVVLALLLVLGLVVAGCSSSGSGGSGAKSAQASQLNDQSGSGKYQGFGLTPAQPRPSFTLTDTAGKPFAFGTATRGRPTLLFFGYTNCPDVCPTTLADASMALKKVPAAVAKKTMVVFVSTDVKRDTGPVIAQWLGNFDRGSKATFVGLRGTQQQVDAAQASAHITLAEDDGQTHSAQLLLYGPDDYARVSFLQSATEQQAITHDLPIVAAERS